MREELREGAGAEANYVCTQIDLTVTYIVCIRCRGISKSDLCLLHAARASEDKGGLQVVKLHKLQKAAFDLLPWAKTESIALQSAWNTA